MGPATFVSPPQALGPEVVGPEAEVALPPSRTLDEAVAMLDLLAGLGGATERKYRRVHELLVELRDLRAAAELLHAESAPRPGRVEQHNEARAAVHALVRRGR